MFIYFCIQKRERERERDIFPFVHPQSIRTQRCTAPSVDKASRKGAACEGKELFVADGARLVLVDLSEERH